MKKYLCLLLTLFSLSASAQLKGDQYTLQVEGDTRSYLMYAPNKETVNRQVLIVLHGGLGNANQIEHRSRLNQLAEKYNSIVVYPNGTGFQFAPNRRTWNAGLCCNPAKKYQTDDVAFLNSLIDELIATHNVDPAGIAMTGFSNGAMMAYEYACQMPDRLSALVPVAGVWVGEKGCQLSTAIPIFHIHGLNDDHVPFEGGIGMNAHVEINHPGVADSINQLTLKRDCETIKHEAEGRFETFSRCKKGRNFKVWGVKGLDHRWPETLSEDIWIFISKKKRGDG